jgi:hypothetical protein
LYSLLYTSVAIQQQHKRKGAMAQRRGRRGGGLWLFSASPRLGGLALGLSKTSANYANGVDALYSLLYTSVAVQQQHKRKGAMAQRRGRRGGGLWLFSASPRLGDLALGLSKTSANNANGVDALYSLLYPLVAIQQQHKRKGAMAQRRGRRGGGLWLFSASPRLGDLAFRWYPYPGTRFLLQDFRRKIPRRAS